MSRPKGIPATDKQKAAASKNSRRANAVRAERKALRRAKEEKPRWQQLEDGDISVRDLTMDELLAGEVTNNDGSREGRRHRFSVQWLNRMNHERVKRVRAGIDVLAQPALDAIKEMIEDDENPAQRAAMSKMVIEYQIGKVPEVIHVGQETEWDRMTQSAYVIQRGLEAVTVEDDPPVEGPDTVHGEVLRSRED